MLLLALALATAGSEAQEGEAPQPRLVDFAADAAVFDVDGKRVLVRLEEQLPSTEARVVHVGAGSLLLEYPAGHGRERLQVELRRGDVVPREVSSLPVAEPSVSVAVRRSSGDSAQASGQSPPSEAD